MSTEKRLLPCAMTLAERHEALEELRTVLDELDITDDRKKATAKNYSDLLKDLNARRDQLRSQLRKTDEAPHGTTLREVEVARRGDLLVRLDTDEVLEVLD